MRGRRGVRAPLSALGALAQRKRAGRVCVLGSTAMLADEWVDKEQNLRVRCTPRSPLAAAG